MTHKTGASSLPLTRARRDRAGLRLTPHRGATSHWGLGGRGRGIRRSDDRLGHHLGFRLGHCSSRCCRRRSRRGGRLRGRGGHRHLRRHRRSRHRCRRGRGNRRGRRGRRRGGNRRRRGRRDGLGSSRGHGRHGRWGRLGFLLRGGAHPAQHRVQASGRHCRRQLLAAQAAGRAESWLQGGGRGTRTWRGCRGVMSFPPSRLRSRSQIAPTRTHTNRVKKKRVDAHIYCCCVPLLIVAHPL
jgi:hypothetical protein